MATPHANLKMTANPSAAAHELPTTAGEPATAAEQTLAPETAAEVPNAAKADDDDDLDDLLDEFDEQVLSKPPGDGKPQDTPFQTDIEELVKDLNIEDPATKEQFEQLVKQFEETHKEEAKRAMDPQNFDSVMKDAIDRLKKLGETIDEQLKNEPSSGPEDMIAQLMAGMGAGGENMDMLKLLTDMLEQLSLKEVIYEPIKDLNLKFPKFLEEKKAELDADVYANYVKQHDVTGEILAVFDLPGYQEERDKDKINSLLELLQELGNPPKELVGDDANFAELDKLGGLDFDLKDLPQDLEKELEKGCQQT